jgi:hypothetical protein
MLPPPYTTQSQATFYTTGSGDRVCFRSLLEARWAWAFERLGFEWEYEPRSFLLPSGAVYTPDFYLETVGWIEIKPTLTALMAVEPKLREFTDRLDDLVPEESVARFYSITAEHPRLHPVVPERRSPLLEWLPGEFRGGNLAYAVGTMCPPHAEWFSKDHPSSYSSHIGHVLRLASEQQFDDHLRLGEIIRRLLMREGGVENLLWEGLRKVSTGRASRSVEPPLGGRGPGERADDRPRRTGG